MTDKTTRVVHRIEFVDVAVYTYPSGYGCGWYAWAALAEGAGETEEAAIADCIDNLRKCLRGEP